ncbi:MAG: sensor histidine kinase [Bdellovibrionia bacterium]
MIENMELIHGGEISLSSDGPTIGLWNENYLRRMIENLIDNAFKYRTPQTPIRISLKHTQEKAVIDIHNEGNPIALCDQVVLFSPFRRIKTADTHKGWGLGLTLVRGVVEALHGSIRIESTAATGTSFIVELPHRDRLT